jgi:uncharacterized protein YutE (UPF0331/DUF86 family)
MYDLQRVGKIIADIKKYLGELDSYKIKSSSDLADSKTYNAAAMVLFAVLNRAIDLGGEIIAAENLGAPSRYQDIMPILSKAGIMNKEMADRINNVIKKRNMLAHFYGDITEKELFGVIKDISIIEKFVEIVKKRAKF